MLQVKFEHRIAAATTLSDMLKGTTRKIDKKSILVLGLARAGVITADIVAKKLAIPNFDIIFPKKLTDPSNKEQAIGSIIDNDIIYILQGLVKNEVSQEYLKREIYFQTHEISQRKRKYYQIYRNNSILEKIKNTKIIILLDDGISTGATMAVSVRWVRQLCNKLGIPQKRIIIAAPVAPKKVLEQMINEFNIETVTVFTPSTASFHSVEQYHQDFREVTDEQVMDIIRNNKL